MSAPPPDLSSSFSDDDSGSASDTTVDAEYQAKPPSHEKLANSQSREVVVQLSIHNTIAKTFPARILPLSSFSATSKLVGPKKGTFVTSSTRKIYKPLRYLPAHTTSIQPLRNIGINSASNRNILSTHLLPNNSAEASGDISKMSRNSDKRRTTTTTEAKPQKVTRAKSSGKPSLHRASASSSSIAQLPTPASEENEDSGSADNQDLAVTAAVNLKMNATAKISRKRKVSSNDTDRVTSGSSSKKQRTSPAMPLQEPAKTPKFLILTVTKDKKHIREPSTDDEDESELEISDHFTNTTSIAKKAPGRPGRKKRGVVASAAAKDEAEFVKAKPKIVENAVSKGTRTSGRIRAPTKKFDTRDASKTLSPEPKPAVLAQGSRRSKRSIDVQVPEEVVDENSEDLSTANSSFASSTVAVDAPVQPPEEASEEVSEEAPGSSPEIQDYDGAESEPIAPTVPVKATKAVKAVRKTSKATKAKDVRPALKRVQSDPLPSQPAADPPAPRLNRRNFAQSQEDELLNNVSSLLSRRKKAVPPWADRNHTEFDLMRWLKSDEILAKDHLLNLPGPNHTYTDKNGKLKDPHRYSAPSKPGKLPHPKLVAHYKKGTDRPATRLYYQDIAPNHSLPIAGVIRTDLPKSDPRHLATAENATQEFGPLEAPKPYIELSAVLDKITNDENYEDYEARCLTFDTQEDSFHAKPTVKLAIPDFVKAILVDDWEYVTKNQQLVPLPAPHSVDDILRDYLDSEKLKRTPGSDQEILEEVIEGLKEYFEKCLGRILLYRFERAQYIEIRDGWLSHQGELSGKNASSTYGAEHLCRLIVTLPELIGQTNMDLQSVNRLKEELTKLTLWLERNARTYFASEYETPAQEYIDRARSA